MTKLSQPLFSFSATGGLANTLAFRQRDGVTIAERIPTPKDTRTLAQIYQRWLYQDYIDWWHEQPPATRLLYEKNARPFHMSGFAYWMKVMLTTLPDIAGMWYLDEGTGLTIQDFSRNANTGLISGATWLDGHIGHALSFNGTTSKVHIPDIPALRLTTGMTLECFCSHYTTATSWDFIFAKRQAPLGDSYGLFKLAGNNAANVEIFIPARKAAASIDTLPPDTWGHICGTYDGVNLICFLNGSPGTPLNCPGTITQNLAGLYLGWALDNAYALKGKIDMVIIRNRALSQTTITRHAAWAYP